MAFRYVCGACETFSDHGDRAQAEAERADHHRRAHHGRAPLEEWVTDMDAFAARKASASYRRAVLGEPVFVQLLKWMLATWPRRLVLLVLVLAVGLMLPLQPPR
ncbi:hypothetical protein PUR71_00865 [Streptomyces sp. SP17BM10]|uniref:hypothetical protein n=1 Tax=Streptomyces sp. SP17BM10 TaxID=3002530 RepID=UPI002E7A90B9|nr:hypothetical protein [Streptomyces sp. SP17BM10]MEE1781497.1 hypothetical protein [Streptomyces sp. SP17BM10]